MNDQFKGLKLIEEFKVLPNGTYDKKLDFERDIQPFVEDKKQLMMQKM